MGAYINKIARALFTKPVDPLSFKDIGPVLDLLTKFPIKTTDKDDRWTTHTWNGSVLRLGQCANASEILHELSHWQWANEAERATPEFGLGQSPASFVRASPTVSNSADYEEVGSLLGILWEMNLGYNHNYTLRGHCWLHDNMLFSEFNSLISSPITSLYEAGLISASGNPLLRYR